MHPRILVTALIGLAIATTLPGPAAAAGAAPDAVRELPGVVDRVTVDDRGEFVALPGGSRRAAGTAGETIALVHTPTGVTALPGRLGAGLRGGQDVVVSIRRGTAVAVRPQRLASARTGVAAPSATGHHTLTLLPVYWTAPDAQTTAGLTTLAQQTAQYWAEQSGGLITLTTSVQPWHRITDPGSCDPAALANAALAANGMPGPVAGTNHVMIYFPTRPDCSWAGLGSVGGSMIWDNGFAITDVTAHEFGHNLGLGHANSADCTAGATPVPLSTSCQVNEYADGADVMGYARIGAPTGGLNTALADALGLARTVTADPHRTTLVSLAPLGRIAQTRAVRIPVPAGTVYVDFRPAVGRDTRRADWAGVQVHLRPASDPATSQLLNLQPAAPAWSQPQLGVHQVWPIPGSGLSVVVTATADGGTASVTITPTAGDVTPPAAPRATATTTTAADGSTALRLTWDPVADAGTGIASYVASAGGSVLGRAGPAQTSLDARLPAGATTVRLDAVDYAGNAAGTDVVPQPGTAAGGGTGGPAPGPVHLLQLAGPIVVGVHSVLLAWSPVTAGVAGVAGSTVGYRISVNGVMLGTIGGTSVTVTALPEGPSVIEIAAVDGADLAGPPARLAVTVDSLAPAAPGRPVLRAGVLRWQAPADHGTALRYRIYRDGGLLATVSGTSLRLGSRPGRHTWSIRAVDAAGNTSASVRLLTRR